MPKGVTQDQVNAAIDALVAAGERPTIERVRVKLGTGSPNTLTRMLDAWWAQLHERLTRQQAKLAVPDAPEDVAIAATRLWQLALEHAGAKAEQGTSAQREALAQDRAALAATQAHAAQQLQDAAAAVAEAQRERDGAVGRLTDLQRLLDQQTASLTDLQVRLGQAVAQSGELAGRLEGSQAALLAARSEAAAERATLESSHRAAEDRWMNEVDKARQDLARTTTRLQQMDAASKVSAEKSAAEVAQHVSQLRRAEQDLARKDARVVALEEQLERLHRQLGSALASGRERDASTPKTRSRRPSTAPESPVAEGSPVARPPRRATQAKPKPGPVRSSMLPARGSAVPGAAGRRSKRRPAR